MTSGTMTDGKQKELARCGPFAAQLAKQSGALIMGYYGTGVAVERKADASPVTIADREAEALMRREIAKAFPAHQVLGEEAGLSGPEDSAWRWVLDPIDGTKSFIHGVPLFGTLIALLHEGQPVLGAIHLPTSGDLVLGIQGQPTTLNGKAVRVKETTRLEEATFCVTSTRSVAEHGFWPGYEALQRRVRLVRGWGDCYGHFLVATGRADIMFDAVMNLWDIAALKPCIEGAGGRITDAQGDPQGNDSALSTNGYLHDEVLAILQGRDG